MPKPAHLFYKGSAEIIKITVITSFLAVLFVISGCFFLRAYNDYTINCKKFSILQGRKNFIKAKIKEIERKKKILQNLNTFIADVKASGLTEENWDRFSVILKDRFLSFPELEKILAITDSSDICYFKPLLLHIRRDHNKINNDGGMNGHNIVSDAPSPPASSRASALLQAAGSPQTSDKLNSTVPQANKADINALTNLNESKHLCGVIMTLKGFFLIKKR